MASVCLDIFSMPRVTWQGQEYDCFILIVDRLTGWMIARPTLSAGLTGEKAAHLIFDASFGEIGLPSIITTDQDPRFTSSFFLTVCARLGIRCVFSQAHRPQANGRVEVAGRVLKDIIRKVAMERKKSWMEILPCALRIRHDLVDPEIGYSPYQLLFGRERPGTGLPWNVEHENESARVWIRNREQQEGHIASILRKRILEGLKRINQKRQARKFQVGDRVWLKRPKGITGPSPTEALWTGPYRIGKQVGTNSFVLKIGRTEIAAHADQLKLALEAGGELDWSVAGSVLRTLPPNPPLAKHTPPVVSPGTPLDGTPPDGQSQPIDGHPQPLNGPPSTA
ncbi:hypothetical protein M569_07036 [Genlisea aurea]|uniref:Integrase catalytic domain-containing protein n=1 Tax=Genlisea aurea TaxID=192259 RepID=S8DWW3_9LAMI|nr:hypothetical protein M569_07036 [Genlisea aurea]